MASSKNGLSPVVVFLLGAASATALIVFVFTSTASPAWPTPEATPATRQEEKAAAVACAPRAKGADSETRRAARTNQTGGEGDDDDEFARMVRRAAMEDRTVIMTSVNEAWAAPGSLMDSFLESFRVGENISHFVEHIVVVAMDEGALRRCRAVHPHCYLLLPEVAGLDLSGAKSYMTKDYLDLVWSKLKLQQRVLELGYNLLFTASKSFDVDLAWFRNPMVHITAAADITTSSDFYFGDPDDLGNYPNTGFIYFKATPRNARAMAYWHAARRRFPGEHDQFVFNEIKRELAAGDGVGVRIRFIDTAAVSGFCQLGRDLNRIATVHMTCCIGLENKLHDLRNVIRDWRRYVARPRWERQMGKIGWTFEGGKCIH
uniref:Nucleotide-diphospho-sugar transferase domain-containing protein n=1 Tax=Oryza meridionalis TaxID=40149 RepID=A0A0E0CCA6_9ORYZ